MAIDLPTKTKPHATIQRRNRNAYERSIAVFRVFREMATPEEMERIAAHLEQALTPKSPTVEGSAVREFLTQTQTFTARERLEYETASIARHFQKRQDLLRDTLSAPQAAQLLGTTRQTPHDRAKAGTLLAVRERSGLRFPRWQFDANGSNGVLNGLPEVFRALNVSALEKVAWFVRPHPDLEGKTPLEIAQSGQSERLVPLARRVGVN